MSTSSTRRAPINLGPGLTPREAAADAVYRLCQALDFNDKDLLRSAFVEDAVYDMKGISSEMPEQKGVENIVNGVLAHVGPMATSHNISNLRVKLDEKQDQAEVACYCIAQHFRSGEGHDPSKRDYLLYGTMYWADVVKTGDGEDALWKMRRFEIHLMWCEGDQSVAKG